MNAKRNAVIRSEDGAFVYVWEDDRQLVLRYPSTGGPADLEIALTSGAEVWEVTMTQDANSFVCLGGHTQSDVWIADDFDPEVQ